MIREALKQGFPMTKFSVRMSKSTYDWNISVRWTDGPTQKQVKPILDRFESKGFDGMTDCSYSCGERMLAGAKVEVDGNYVSGSRSLSNRLRQIVAEKLAAECGIEGVTVDANGNVRGAEQSVPFAWFQHWDTKHWTLEEFLAKKFVLVSDQNGRGEWLSNLVYRVEGNISLEEQKPIASELLPEYINVQETVSTGRAESFEPRMQKFEGHAALEAENAPILERLNAPVPMLEAPSVDPATFHCSIGKSYPKVRSISDRVQ